MVVDNSIISVLSETSESIEEVVNHNEEVQIHTIDETILIPEEEINKIIDDIQDENIEISSIQFLQVSEVDKLSSGLLFKCDKCDKCEFASTRRITFNDHKITNHNWCHICYSSFQRTDKLVTHMNKTHSVKKRLTGTGKGP